jgi:PAS domain S-box-containing protein
MALAEKKVAPKPVLKAGSPEAAPALYRLLSDSALSRAALGACGFPLAMLDARSGSRPLTYVNAAFEGFFGYRAGEALGRTLAALLFRGDDPLVHRLLAESSSRWKLRAWGKDGVVRHVEISFGTVHSADGQLTHWVVAFADRSEVEKLRAELEGLQALAAAP